MNHKKITLAIALMLLSAPHSLAAQADWTFQVPLSLSNITSDVTEGAVLCVVGQTSAINGEGTAQLVRSLDGGETLAQPGEAASEWESITVTDGVFPGYNTFAIDGSGNGPASVTVEVVAAESVSSVLRVTARFWGCALALRVQGGWFSVHPELFNGESPQSTQIVEGSTFQGWVGGEIN